MLKWLWLAAVVVILDQLSKWMAVANLDEGQMVAVMPHLNFALVYNTGAAFSFLGDQGGWQRWFFVVLSFAVSAYILYWLKRLPSSAKLLAIALSLVLGGALGNGIDRLLNGKVTDFIDFYVNMDVFFLSNGHFATFNIADIAITLGAILLIFVSLFLPEPELN